MRKWILPALMGLGFLLGLGITLYPAVSNYLLEKNQSTAMQGYIEEQEKVPDEVSERLKQEAREYNEKLREGTVVLTDPFDPEALKYITDEYEEMLNPDGDGLMGYLEIPSIKVYLPVYHGTSDGVLQAGVGHLGNTSLPVGGENTHAVLSGHTGLPNARLLTDLDKLQEKDQFYLHVLDEVLAYEVDQIKVVEPDNISDIFIEDGKDYVTLDTCTPYGINSHRLLIRGTRIPYDEKYAEKVPLKPAPAVSDRPAEEQGRKLGTRQWILFAIAAFGVAILLGILAPSGKKKGKASSKTEETADQRNKELSQNSKAEKKEGSHEKNEEEK